MNRFSERRKLRHHVIKFQSKRIKARSCRVIRVLEGGGHTHPQRPPFKQATIVKTMNYAFKKPRAVNRLFLFPLVPKTANTRPYCTPHMNKGGPRPQLCTPSFRTSWCWCAIARSRNYSVKEPKKKKKAAIPRAVSPRDAGRRILR